MESDSRSDDDEPAGSALLEPPKPGRGQQFTLKTSIPPGVELENCMFVRTREAMIVNRDEIRFSTGSHHVLLYMTPYEEIPTEDLSGAAIDTSGVFDCSDGVQGFFDVAGLVGVSQNATGRSAISFPEGVGVRVPANTVLLFNVHYVNPTDDTLEPEVAVNLHSISEEELEQEGGLLFWYNPFLKVPARGRSTMTSNCPVPSDIKLTNVQSHMHRRGVDYRSTLISPDGDRDEIYTSRNWSDVEVAEFSPSLEIRGGSRLEWSCDYMNSEDHDIYQGARSTDEMCMLIGSYYPADPVIGYCMRDEQAFLGAEWTIGQGTSSCGQSLDCLSAVSDPSPTTVAFGAEEKSQTARITDCLLASKPAVASQLSAAVGCLAIAGEAGAEECAAEIEACVGAP